MSGFYRECYCSLLDACPQPVTRRAEWERHGAALEQDRLRELFQDSPSRSSSPNLDAAVHDEREEHLDEMGGVVGEHLDGVRGDPDETLDEHEMHVDPGYAEENDDLHHAQDDNTIGRACVVAVFLSFFDFLRMEGVWRVGDEAFVGVWLEARIGGLGFTEQLIDEVKVLVKFS
ncbi:uncharacterized protein LAJ45_02943 [Morchella importuna]|uniref:uncharacterized protein n=1 Tax=Morchella importuna TaxID=1174673 RepID=UPI001E8CB1CD|nr:uncharacterized protein LAJ45_02943 [Morchella importuna]KAH8152719.1 hypothetical protein LAJ45_02943 [Morchella importuna]